MTTKNWVLAIAAFMVAIGLALASNPDTSIQDTFVKGRYTENGEISCVNTLKQCSRSSNQLCTVVVPTSKPGTGGTTIADSNGPYYTTGDADCEMPLFHDHDLGQSANIQMYELLP